MGGKLTVLCRVLGQGALPGRLCQLCAHGRCINSCAVVLAATCCSCVMSAPLSMVCVLLWMYH